MSTTLTPTLVRLDDTGMTVADPTEDIRGWSVVDKSGEEIGKVDGLLIDPTERKVRFLEVATGGFLGIGEKTFLIPVDAIGSIDGEIVRVDTTREHVAGAPTYDPNVTSEADVWEHSYGYYGYTPYWGSGYAFPGIGAMVGTVPRATRRTIA